MPVSIASRVGSKIWLAMGLWSSLWSSCPALPCSCLAAPLGSAFSWWPAAARGSWAAPQPTRSRHRPAMIHCTRLMGDTSPSEERSAHQALPVGCPLPAVRSRPHAPPSEGGVARDEDTHNEAEERGPLEQRGD